MKKLSLAHFIILFMVIGVFSGILAGQVGFSWLLHVSDFVATLFLRLLKMIIVPLIFSSIITGVSNAGGTESLGKMGTKTLAYYILSSFLAIVLGLVLVNLIQPGLGVDLGLRQVVHLEAKSSKDFLDVFIRMIPENLVYSAGKGEMLSIIFFSVLFGVFLLKLGGEQERFLKSFFASCFSVMMKMTSGILYLAPLGVWGLMTKLVAQSGFSAFIPLAWYSLCVFLALGIHALFTLPFMVYMMTSKNPFHLLMNMKIPLMTAFSTASSSATLPLTLSHLEDKAKVSQKVSSFVLPLGATINMDGTALYECVAVIFISQAYGVELSFLSQIMVVMTALLASIGAAGIPMAGLVMMSVVLTAVGLPLEGVGLIIAVDRVLDMCRTTVNVWSDSCGAFIIDNLDKKKEFSN